MIGPHIGASKAVMVSAASCRPFHAHILISSETVGVEVTEKYGTVFPFLHKKDLKNSLENRNNRIHKDVQCLKNFSLYLHAKPWSRAIVELPMPAAPFLVVEDPLPVHFVIPPLTRIG